MTNEERKLIDKHINRLNNLYKKYKKEPPSDNRDFNLKDIKFEIVYLTNMKKKNIMPSEYKNWII